MIVSQAALLSFGEESNKRWLFLSPPRADACRLLLWFNNRLLYPLLNGVHYSFIFTFFSIMKRAQRFAAAVDVKRIEGERGGLQWKRRTTVNTPPAPFILFSAAWIRSKKESLVLFFLQDAVTNSRPARTAESLTHLYYFSRVKEEEEPYVLLLGYCRRRQRKKRFPRI